MRVSRSLRRCSRNTATALGGSESVRLPCLVFGGLKRSPLFVSSRERSIRTVARSKATSESRNANNSPRRIPVARSRATISYSEWPTSSSFTWEIWSSVRIFDLLLLDLWWRDDGGDIAGQHLAF